jgi:hypothetical protein
MAQAQQPGGAKRAEGIVGCGSSLFPGVAMWLDMFPHMAPSGVTQLDYTGVVERGWLVHGAII